MDPICVATIQWPSNVFQDTYGLSKAAIAYGRDLARECVRSRIEGYVPGSRIQFEDAHDGEVSVFVYMVPIDPSIKELVEGQVRYGIQDARKQLAGMEFSLDGEPLPDASR